MKYSKNRTFWASKTSNFRRGALPRTPPGLTAPDPAKGCINMTTAPLTLALASPAPQKGSLCGAASQAASAGPLEESQLIANRASQE